ncbi:hypothetical protein M2352_004568 [Azospirillum fermentarium]|uniref:hypothetical protein n=1 Tax=Azospirillum fermentarium TaxID=1233114 RepID=UPI002227CC17|nr:hypothetical protein [Azospirillum fermentarium]MCW2248908.1 hypothetical protein [Azospirillum fermentarium]
MLRLKFFASLIFAFASVASTAHAAPNENSLKQFVSYTGDKLLTIGCPLSDYKDMEIEKFSPESQGWVATIKLGGTRKIIGTKVWVREFIHFNKSFIPTSVNIDRADKGCSFVPPEKVEKKFNEYIHYFVDAAKATLAK